MHILVIAIVMQTGWLEPTWSTVAMTDSKAVFGRIRREIQSKYGSVPRDAVIPKAVSDAAISVFQKSKRKEDGFRALYLRNITDGPRDFPANTNEPWDTLPATDYEVLRLRYLWSFSKMQGNLLPLGERLLKQDPRDAEVLWAQSYILSHFGPKGIWNPAKGVELAKQALDIAPCGVTYLRYADARGTLCLESKSKTDGSIAAKYYQKYLDYPRTTATERKQAIAALVWLRKNGFG